MYKISIKKEYTSICFKFDDFMAMSKFLEEALQSVEGHIELSVSYVTGKNTAIGCVENG